MEILKVYTYKYYKVSKPESLKNFKVTVVSREGIEIEVAEWERPDTLNGCIGHNRQQDLVHSNHDI